MTRRSSIAPPSPGERQGKAEQGNSTQLLNAKCVIPAVQRSGLGAMQRESSIELVLELPGPEHRVAFT